jgi:broad specificity polyphosphatase/5'/3'-nucleotidase SurE
VDGNWALASNPPAALDKAKQMAVDSQQVDLMPPGASAPTTTPAVYASTAPAELIQTQGAPSLVPVEGTDEDTDRWAFERGYVSMTPLRLDLTDEEQLARAKKLVSLKKISFG